MTGKKSPSPKSSSSGFTLVELAVVISMAALMIIAGLKLYKTWAAYEQLADNQARMAVIQQALGNYMTQHNRLPCPASYIAPSTAANYAREITYPATTGCGSSTGSTPYNYTTNGPDVFQGTAPALRVDGTVVLDGNIEIGSVPVRDLGLPDSYRADVYGYLFTYAVTRAATTPSPSSAIGIIEVVDGKGTDATPVPLSPQTGVGTALYVIVEHGQDGKGAYYNGSTAGPAKPCASAPGLDTDNCNLYASKFFRYAQYSKAPGATSWFDDLVVFGTTSVNPNAAACMTVYSSATNPAFSSVGTSEGHYYSGAVTGTLDGWGFWIGYVYGFYDQINSWIHLSPPNIFGAITYTGQGPMVGAYCPAGFNAMGGGCNQTYNGATYGGDILQYAGTGQVGTMEFPAIYGPEFLLIPGGYDASLAYSQITLPPFSHPAMPVSGLQGWECNGSSAASAFHIDLIPPYIHPATGMQTQAYAVCCTGGG